MSIESLPSSDNLSTERTVSRWTIGNGLAALAITLISVWVLVAFWAMAMESRPVLKVSMLCYPFVPLISSALSGISLRFKDSYAGFRIFAFGASLSSVPGGLVLAAAVAIVHAS